VGLDTLEVGDGFVEAGELFFDFGDDFALLLDPRKRYFIRRELIEVNTWAIARI
jgi:hypothetical protein